MILSACAELSHCFAVVASVKLNFSKVNATAVTSIVVHSPIDRDDAVLSVSRSRKISRIVAEATQCLTYRDAGMDIDVDFELVLMIANMTLIHLLL